jgi:hypothetical protein
VIIGGLERFAPAAAMLNVKSDKLPQQQGLLGQRCFAQIIVNARWRAFPPGIIEAFAKVGQVGLGRWRPGTALQNNGVAHGRSPDTDPQCPEPNEHHDSGNIATTKNCIMSGSGSGKKMYLVSGFAGHVSKAAGTRYPSNTSPGRKRGVVHPRPLSYDRGSEKKPADPRPFSIVAGTQQGMRIEMTARCTGATGGVIHGAKT